MVLPEELTYRRESLLGEELTVSVAVAALSDDAGRGTIVQAIRKPDGSTAATVHRDGGWLSVRKRKLAAPPVGLADVTRSAPRLPGPQLLEG